MNRRHAAAKRVNKPSNVARIDSYCPQLRAVTFGLRSMYRDVKKVAARLRELATMLGTSSRNLADTFFDNPVFAEGIDAEPSDEIIVPICLDLHLLILAIIACL